MRAMMLRQAGPGASPLEPAELPEPTAGPGQLVLQVSACAVCRTDLQLARGDLAARGLPLVLGHQAVGRVRAVGAGVRGWTVGDRAGAGWLGWACGECAACGGGRENLCERAQFTGWTLPGAFAEQMAVHADFALRLPDSMKDASIAPLLCGGVIGYRALRRSGIQPGGRLGLFGFGASARLAIQVARHWGCEVFAFARDGRDRGEALRMGAAWAGALDASPPQKLDAAVTFAPVGVAAVAALKALRPGGTVAINAIHLDGIPAFSYDDLWGERQLASVANYTRQDARELLSLAADIPLTTSVETFALSDANRALTAHEAGSLTGTAVLVP